MGAVALRGGGGEPAPGCLRGVGWSVSSSPEAMPAGTTAPTLSEGPAAWARKRQRCDPPQARPFEVRTRLLVWDARAFYLEARFVSLRDGFVCALLRSRQHVLGTSPERVVRHLCKRRVEPPELPEDLRHWIAYNETSSQLLRAESGLSDVVKDQ
eukprot:XP_851251.1 protein THEM6 [Canis lupus familiaris]